MIATVSMRFREQQLTTTVLGAFLDAGWTYNGYLPGPEYTTKTSAQTTQLGNMSYTAGMVEKDQWYLMMFSSDTATEIPEGLGEIQISGKKDAFFKWNRPVFLGSRISTYPVSEKFQGDALNEMPVNDGTW